MPALVGAKGTGGQVVTVGAQEGIATRAVTAENIATADMRLHQ